MHGPNPAPHRRSERNDVAIDEAALTVLVEEGWRALTVRNVALRAGLARQTVSMRHRDSADLGHALWTRHLAGPFLKSLHDVLLAHGLDAAPADADAVSAAWNALKVPSAPLRGAMDVFLASPFVPSLASIVDAEVGVPVRAWLSAKGSARTRTSAVLRAALLARALGMLALGCIVDLRDVDLTPVNRAVTRAIAAPARARRIPFSSLPPTVIATGDAQLDALLESTLRHVAAHGYDASSLDRIAADAGITKGYIFNRYPSKDALFVDAAQRRMAAAVQDVAAWLDAMAEKVGRATAEAAFLRFALHPTRAGIRRIASEEFRLAVRSPTIASAVRSIAERTAASLGVVDARTLGYAYTARSLGEGFGLLAVLAPTLWTFPLEVILTPLQDAFVAEFLPPAAPNDPHPAP